MTHSPITSETTFPKTYSGANLLQIAMPMGGIGTGCLCLNGIGGIQDYSIWGKPATTALQDHWESAEAAFALIHIKGANPITRLVEGPFPKERIYDQGVQGQGYRKGGFEGLPRFASSRFTSKYPFGVVDLEDPGIPLTVSIEGWNPFIPLDDINSGIPCAILNYTINNPGATSVDFELSYHISHLAPGANGEKGTRNSVIPNRGISLTNTDESDSPKLGSVALAVGNLDPKLKAMWFRGGWFDSISALWREVSTGSFTENDGHLSENDLEGRNGGSVMVSHSLLPGQSVTIPIVLAWHFPNNPLAVGGVGENKDKSWNPYYSTRWTDAADVAGYVLDNYGDLLTRTRSFQTALFSSSFPPAILDAIASNLAIIKSPTVLRESTGGLWCWEGCFVNGGCCHGSCTHVWNYAQSIPHLFPALERSLRTQEYSCSMDDRGHVNFRSALPAGPTSHEFHAAADGQLGGILKVYREWQICGDRDWLTQMYPAIKLSMDYGIVTWDPKQKGALFEPHHNTYDIEFWGPDGMCTTIYLGALAAMAEMAASLDLSKDVEFYSTIAAKSAKFLDEVLFNGEYYEQHVQWDGLRDKSFADQLAGFPTDGTIDPMSALLKAEGPKYQYGIGCISDGVIGSWMSEIYGIETPISRAKVASHLSAIFKHNFKSDLSDHACLQRPGYAIGDEAGLLLCSWPKGGKPTLPFVYSDEVWTGIEYQVASHMISVGLVEEGLTVVEAVRSRYDGYVRNPFNEYECGNYYARAMASYALLGAYSGFRYSAVSKTLWFGPKVDHLPFTSFFSTASGYGTITLTESDITISLDEGSLFVETFRLALNGKESTFGVSTLVNHEKPWTFEVVSWQ